MESIGGIPLGAPGSPADVGELAAFRCPTAPPTSTVPSTSSTAAVSGECDYGFGIGSSDCDFAVLADLEADRADAGGAAGRILALSPLVLHLRGVVAR